MTDRDGTPVRTVRRAAELGRAEGLRHVYAGNIPGAAGPFEHTWCPSCEALLVERAGYQIRRNRLTPTGGVCPDCRTRVAGVWA